MRSSGRSSKTATNPSSERSTPTRRAFALTGPSRPLDPRTNAVRPDIADVRLADQVFAPHYAAPLDRVLLRDAPLRETRDPGSDSLAELAAGERFELLDVTASLGWGVAPARGLVGYVEAAALGDAA